MRLSWWYLHDIVLVRLRTTHWVCVCPFRPVRLAASLQLAATCDDADKRRRYKRLDISMDRTKNITSSIIVLWRGKLARKRCLLEEQREQRKQKRQEEYDKRRRREEEEEEHIRRWEEYKRRRGRLGGEWIGERKERKWRRWETARMEEEDKAENLRIAARLM